MTKQQEWRERWRLENDKYLPLTISEEGTADFFYSLHLQEIEKIRLEVAKLYCASGCSCCRDDDNWYKSAENLANILDIPKFEDGSGFDFYKVRDDGLLAITDENNG
jgi:hypothetical protein